MGATEKSLNKRIIWAIIGSALIGVSGLSMTPKGQSFWRRLLKRIRGIFSFFSWGVKEMHTQIKKQLPKDDEEGA